MKKNIKLVSFLLILIILLLFATISKATTLTDTQIGTEYEINSEEVVLDEVRPDEIESQFDEITDSNNQQFYYNNNIETYTTGTLNITNETTTTMTQYERGRLNSRVPTVDASLKIYDYANLFTTEQEKELFSQVTSFIEENGMDMAIVTINKNPEFSAMHYADDFNDYNEFGKNSSKDGVLFLIDMDTREMWISTTGAAIRKYNDKEINKTLDRCYAKISRKKYFECASEFIAFTKVFTSTEGTTKVFMPRFDFSQVLAGSIGGLGIGLAYFLIGRAKHKLINRQNKAHDYESKLNLTTNTDILVSHRVDKIYSPVSSSSSGFSGGGSSIHMGSSGTFHGGGGRHF